MSENAIDTYETLRNQFLKGAAKSQELSIILYHGVLRGLQILAKKSVSQFPAAEQQKTPQYIVTPDANLIRLLANMILHKQSEIMHVY